MEFTGSALTALFVGLIWTLIKVVEYFISKRNGKKQALTDEQAKQLYDVHMKTQRLNKIEEILDEMEDKLEHLDEMHSVYDENRVPKWYVSSEMLPMIRQIHNSLEMIGKEFEEDLVAVKVGQATVTQKILDLLGAQKLMIERLGDIIVRLNKSE